MLEYLKVLKNEKFDAVFFLSGNEEDSIKVEINNYKEPGTAVGGNNLGHAWHIVLFKEDEEDNLTNIDNFDAILGCPLEYISGLIPSGWRGIIAKKTTTSDAFIQRVVAKLKE